MDGLNLRLTQGYTSRSSEAGGLQRDQFVKFNKLQAKWYGLHPNRDKPAGSVSFWHCDSAKCNSAYSRIARSSGLTATAHASHTVSQDTLKCWEKGARESTYICNQEAGLSRCLNKVQQGMQTQIRTLPSEQAKGKSAGKVGAATEELQYLMNFSTSITLCVAKAMEHLSDFTSCLHGESYTLQNGLILGSCLVQTQVGHTGSSTSGSSLVGLRTKVGPMVSAATGGTTDFTLTRGRIGSHRNRNLANQHGNNWDVLAKRNVLDSQPSSHHVRPGVSSHINVNYCVSALRLLTWGKGTVNCLNMCQPHQTGLDHNRNRKTVNLNQCHHTGPVTEEIVNCCQSVVNVNSVVVNHAHIVQGQPQKKGVSSAIVRHQSLKYVNNVSYVDNCVL